MYSMITILTTFLLLAQSASSFPVLKPRADPNNPINIVNGLTCNLFGMEFPDPQTAIAEVQAGLLQPPVQCQCTVQTFTQLLQSCLDARSGSSRRPHRHNNNANAVPGVTAADPAAFNAVESPADPNANPAGAPGAARIDATPNGSGAGDPNANASPNNGSNSGNPAVNNSGGGNQAGDPNSNGATSSANNVNAANSSNSANNNAGSPPPPLNPNVNIASGSNNANSNAGGAPRPSDDSGNNVSSSNSGGAPSPAGNNNANGANPSANSQSPAANRLNPSINAAGANTGPAASDPNANAVNSSNDGTTDASNFDAQALPTNNASGRPNRTHRHGGGGGSNGGGSGGIAAFAQNFGPIALSGILPGSGGVVPDLGGTDGCTGADIGLCLDLGTGGA